MSLTRALIFELGAHAGVSGNVSTRIYISRPPRESPTYPMLIVDLVDSEQVMTLGGAVALARYTYDIDVEARTYAEARDTAEQVRLLLHGNTGDAAFGDTGKTVDVREIVLTNMGDSRDGPDDASDRPVFVRNMSVSIWWRQPTS